MVAIAQLRRAVATEHSNRLRLPPFSDRFLRKAFSSRGFVARNPAVFVFLSGLGLLTALMLAANAIALAANGILHVNLPTTVSYLRVAADADATVDQGVSKPIFVIAGGAPRTGSTFIFNLLRILMRIRDPNTVASSNWMLQKLVPENGSLTDYDRIALLRTMGTSILVKVHTAHQYYEFAGPANKRKFSQEVDLLFTGYRDLRDETVSAFKMFAHNRTQWESESKWAEQCAALIRRRNSLILEAGDVVPVVDSRYEDWRDGDESAVLILIRQLAAGIPWNYTEHDYRNVLREALRMRVPTGGEQGNRVEWHVSNLMSPRHISAEHLNEAFIAKGVHAIESEPVCRGWLKEHKYMR